MPKVAQHLRMVFAVTSRNPLRSSAEPTLQEKVFFANLGI